MITLGIFSLIGYGLLLENEQSYDSIKNKYLDGVTLDKFNNRSELLFDMKSYWSRAKELGALPWGQGTMAQAPTTTRFHKPGPPKLAEIIGWDEPMLFDMRSPDKQKRFRENYQMAYSTELAHCVRNQLVPGFWHETITKGPILQQTNTSDGKFNTAGINLYQYSG